MQFPSKLDESRCGLCDQSVVNVMVHMANRCQCDQPADPARATLACTRLYMLVWNPHTTLPGKPQTLNPNL